MSAGLVRDFLDEHATLTLACVDAEGPWAADVYFVRAERSLCFFSSPKSRHSRAFAADPRAAGTVHGTYRGWGDIRGVQLSGTVSPISGAAEKAGVLARYLAKYPFVRDFLTGAGSAFEGRVLLYRLTPTAVHWVDNSAGFADRTAVEW